MKRLLLCSFLACATLFVSASDCQVTKYITANMCPNGSYDFMGRILTQPFRYYDTIPGPNGCDTTIVLDLEYWEPIIPPIYTAICPGYTYNFNGRILDTPGIYYDTLSSILGCDSVQALYLEIGSFAWINLFDSICRVNGSYIFRGDTFYSDRLYAIDTTHSGSPCDTIFSILLRRRDNPTTYIIDSFCAGYTYTFLNRTFTQPTVDTFLFSASSPDACDSLVILDLALKIFTTPPVTRNGYNLFTTFSHGLSYQWLLNDSIIQGAINYFCPISVDGAYRVIVSADRGCIDTSLQYVISNLGVLENEVQNYSVYPNPTHSILHVRSAKVVKAFSIRIQDEIGQILGNWTSEEAQTIDVSSFLPGAYWIIFSDGNNLPERRCFVIY
ncbi:MAG: T9SS type A sorting domain-containing protein [Bacteroidetes bacterium]|nr:T9SS type A sorting domain-containing protein [Bacteroidota bacterium]